MPADLRRFPDLRDRVLMFIIDDSHDRVDDRLGGVEVSFRDPRQELLQRPHCL